MVSACLMQDVGTLVTCEAFPPSGIPDKPTLGIIVGGYAIKEEGKCQAYYLICFDIPWAKKRLDENEHGFFVDMVVKANTCIEWPE